MQKLQRDIVGEAMALFQRLQQERGQHQNRIDEIDRALGHLRGAAPAAAAKTAARPAKVKSVVVGRRGRGGNPMPLRAALVQVLAHGPRTKQELMAGVRKIGYRFKATDPMNSMQAFLYGAGKKLFKRVDGKFSLAAGVSSSTPAAGKPAKVRRVISPEARKRISDAVKARWARQRAGKNAPAKTTPVKPAKAKRNISPESRKKMADAAKRMWAARRKAANK